MLILHWLSSPTWRAAVAERKKYRQWLAARRDELSPAGRASVQAALDALSGAMTEGQAGRIRIKMEELEGAAKAAFRPYAHPDCREALELLLVALVVVLGTGAFFLQCFKIPTGSMQPTLMGVMNNNLKVRKDLTVPSGLARVRDWFGGFSYVRVLARADGVVQRVGPVARLLSINLKQSFWIGGVEHVVWFPPDMGDGRRGIAPLLVSPIVGRDHVFHRGDEVISVRRRSGDYLLADRLTYNFRRPARGEIVVFKTDGISVAARERNNIPEAYFYIKRLVALPGERVQIGDDRHLIINGVRLDARTPHFARVYGFDDEPTGDGPYWGHLNGTVARQYGFNTDYPPLFPDQKTVYTNGPRRYLVMGDNTRDSLDSRYWGPVAADAVVGKCCFVFWPLTRRFGWGNE